MSGLVDDPSEDIWCDKDGIGGEGRDIAIIDISKASHELREQVIDAALRMYLGEVCPYCKQVFRTVEDLHTAVFNGYTDYGRIAHKECFDKVRGEIAAL